MCNWSETLAEATGDHAAEDHIPNWKGGAKMCPPSLWYSEALRFPFTRSCLNIAGETLDMYRSKT